MFDTVKTARKGWMLIAAELLLTLVLAVGGAALITENSIEITACESDVLKAEGYGVYVDGCFIAACNTKSAASDALAKLDGLVAEAYGAPVGEHSLLNSVRVEQGSYLKTAFVTSAQLNALLGVRENGFVFDVYTASGVLTDVTLSVSTKVTVETEEPVAIPVVSVGTDLLDKGEVLVIKNGAEGVSANEYLVTYIDGEKTGSVLTSSTVIRQPVAEEQLYGTDSGATLMSAEDLFTLPCGGWVSSWYGGRILWGQTNFHYGLDFAGDGARKGDPIYAAEDGIVSFAGVHGGFGNKIVIDHTQALSTLYAHCSKLAVTEGQFVRKGEIIGYIGNTGKVTGPHLHFEVLKNGVHTNPKKYIDWSGYQGYVINANTKTDETDK